MKELRQKRENRRIYRWAAACAACMMFLAVGMTAWAARTGNVRVNDVNVRTEASSESNRVCKLPINTAVTIADQAEGSDGKLWYSVTFTLDGAQKAGWIRSDMLTVSEEETPEEPAEGTAPSGGQSGTYSIQEPEEAYPASDTLIQTSVSVGEESFTAWQVDTELTGGSELYLVYASKADGSIGWFYYDPAEGTFQRDLGQFADGGEEPEGLIQALQKELSDLKESSAVELRVRLYIIIGLGVLCVILLVLAIIFGLKYRNAAYEYVDDEDEDGAEEEDDFDDFFAAAKKKKSYEEELTEDEPQKELTEVENQEDEVTEEFPEEELPEIDMSAVLEIEEAEQKEDSGKEDDGLEDFDIEILDWEDLNL